MTTFLLVREALFALSIVLQKGQGQRAEQCQAAERNIPDGAPTAKSPENKDAVGTQYSRENGIHALVVELCSWFCS